MKLNFLVERKKSPKYIRLFHGTSNLKVASDLNLIPHGPLKGSENIDGKKAIFFTPSIELALYYSFLSSHYGIVVEVIINQKSTQLVKDEEHFPLGEIPSWPINWFSDSPHLDIIYPSEEDWSNFWKNFDKIIPKPNNEDKKIFMKAYMKAAERAKQNEYSAVDQFDNYIADAVRKIFLRRSLKPDINIKNFSGNAMLVVNDPITLRGRNKIVGVYYFEMGKIDNKTIAICRKVIYSNGGSIKEGDKFIPKRDWST